MLIDCDACALRGAACSPCLVTLLDGGQPGGGLTDEEQRAIEVFARAGFEVEVIGEAPAPARRQPRPARSRRRRLTA